MSTDGQKTMIAERPAGNAAADQTKRIRHQSFHSVVQQLRQGETVYAVVTPVANEHFVKN